LEFSSIIDLSLGLSWEEFWCQDRYHTELAVGWEHHVWFDIDQRTISDDWPIGSVNSTFGNYRNRTGDTDSNLTFGVLLSAPKLIFNPHHG